MKKFAIILSIIISSQLYFTGCSYAVDQLELCKKLNLLAEEIMKSRQMGVPMAAMMEAAASGNITVLNKLQKNFIIEAYDSPKYDSPEMQQNAITEFGNKQYLICIKSTK